MENWRTRSSTDIDSFVEMFQWVCFFKCVKKSSKKQIVSRKEGNGLKTKKNSALFISHSSEADNSHSKSIKVGSIECLLSKFRENYISLKL